MPIIKPIAHINKVNYIFIYLKALFETATAISAMFYLHNLINYFIHWDKDVSFQRNELKINETILFVNEETAFLLFPLFKCTNKLIVLKFK